MYQPSFLTTTEANNIQAAITTSNGGSPPTNLCWNGSPIIDEGTLTSAVNSGTIDILVGLNWNNGAPIWSEATKTAISAALHAGTLQKLLVYDRFANNDVQFPGLEAGSVVLEFGVEPIRPIIALDSPNVGPAGTVGTWSACWSNHGYIVPVVPLSQAEFHYERVPDTKPVSVQFCHNDKLVYYSTTPQDAYLDGYTCDLPFGSANMLFANTLWKIATEFCCVPSPTTYRLWNAATDTLVGTLDNGTSYCIDYPYNIEAQVTCPTLPVGMKIWPQGGSTIARQKEYEAPYYLWGNNGADVLPNPKKKPLPLGVYHVSDLSGGNSISFTQTCISLGA